MKYTIYKTTNLISGKYYIGKHQTEDPCDNYLGSGNYIRRAIDKHGKENFVKEVLYIFDTEEEMNAKEAELVTDEFCLREDTYNICPGGKGGWGYVNQTGLNHSTKSKEKKQRGSRALVLKMKTDPNFKLDFSKKISASVQARISRGEKLFNHQPPPFLGRTHTEETKKKMRQAQAGKHRGPKNSQYGTRWIYSIEEKRSRKIPKDQQLPAGWYEGRRLSF
jgi:group I intron endonuclease